MAIRSLTREEVLTEYEWVAFVLERRCRQAEYLLDTVSSPVSADNNQVDKIPESYEFVVFGRDITSRSS